MLCECAFSINPKGNHPCVENLHCLALRNFFFSKSGTKLILSVGGKSNMSQDFKSKSNETNGISNLI